jgi:hypothetical protein
MAGKDVREALYDVRVGLFEAMDAGHDWVSMVAYVRLPEGYSDCVIDVTLQSHLAALETASNYAKQVIENKVSLMSYFGEIADRLQARIRLLESYLEEIERTEHRRKIDVLQENSGLLGSAFKRLAELYSERAAAEATGPAEWLEKSRSALERSRQAYSTGFLRNTSHHWRGVQYLALEAVLQGSISVEHWYACKVAATADSRRNDASAGIWALGSLAELALLAPVAGVNFDPKEANALVTQLRTLEEASAQEFPQPTPTRSTFRQLQRYVFWWTKQNGFFPGRAADLAEESSKLSQLLI